MQRFEKTPMKKKDRKTKWASFFLGYGLLQVFSLSICFFIRNSLDINRYGCFDAYQVGDNEVVLRLNSEKESRLKFDSCEAIVFDCYSFNRKERLQICSFINDEWKRMGIPHRRSIQSLEAEVAFHSYSYKMGIDMKSAKDANLGYEDDPRWYVDIATSAIEVLGL